MSRTRNWIKRRNKTQRRSGIESLFSFDKSHYTVKGGSFKKAEICVDRAIHQSSVSCYDPPRHGSCSRTRGKQRQEGEAMGWARCQRMNIFIFRNPSSILQLPHPADTSRTLSFRGKEILCRALSGEIEWPEPGTPIGKQESPLRTTSPLPAVTACICRTNSRLSYCIVSTFKRKSRIIGHLKKSSSVKERPNKQKT